MTNDGGNDENDNGNTKPPVSTVCRTTSTTSVTIANRPQTNGSIGGGFSDGNNSCAEADGSASDDCGDKMAKESDPLQPKMVKSRSAHKVREIKEVRPDMFLHNKLSIINFKSFFRG